MNDQTRKEITKLIELAEREHTMEDLRERAQMIADEEREKFENMEEHFPDSPQLEKLEEAADALDEAVERFESAATEMTDAIEQLTNATA